MAYSVKRVTNSNLTYDLLEYFNYKGRQLSELYPYFSNWSKLPLEIFNEGYIFMAFDQTGQPKGLMMLDMGPAYFDATKTQCILMTISGDSPRVTSTLLHHFIDFGKANADHIIMSIAKHTNIKPESVLSLGFKELETAYIMEV